MKESTRKVLQIGECTGITLPIDFLRESGLNQGDFVTVKFNEKTAKVKPIGVSDSFQNKKKEMSEEDIEFKKVHLALPEDMMDKAVEIVNNDSLGYSDFGEFVRGAVREKIMKMKAFAEG